MVRTKIKLKDTHLAERIRDNLFTEQQKNLLNYHVGSTGFDVKDQILHHYGEQFLMGSEDDIFHGFAHLLVEKGFYGLEKLKVLEDRLPYMMMPANFYKTDVKQYTRDQTLSNESQGGTTGESHNNNYSLSLSDSVADNKVASVNRSAVAANSQETTNLEKQMYDGLKLTTFGRKLGKRKKINATIENGTLKKVETAEEGQDDNTVVPFEGTRDLPHLYAQQSITTGGNMAVTNQDSSMESMSTSLNKYSNNFNNNLHSVGHIAGGINIKSYTSTEADMNVLRMEIPRIRTKFGGVFGPLFTIRKY